ncbi:hypothetical protein F6455_07565 [Proteobacteria bacterium 005FR1]|nr:hypothetical protein [Proteobacteria bacterium 005FR1]
MAAQEEIRTVSPYKRHEYALALIILGLGIALAIVGNVLDWNQSFNWFDETLHFLLPFAAALAGCMALYGKSIMGARSHPVPMVLMIMLLGVGLGGIWEIGEWLYAQAFLPADMLSSKQDTMIDLMLDGLGALLAGILAVRLAAR